MDRRLETARAIRLGAENLRKVVAEEAEPAIAAAELLEMAQQMDDHAAEIEQSVRNDPTGATMRLPDLVDE